MARHLLPILALAASCKAPPGSVADGRIVLVPIGLRHLDYGGEDVDPALDALRRFLDALPKEKLTRLAAGHARLDIDPAAVDLRWRVEGEGEARTLRIAAIPRDPYDDDDPAIDVATAVERWFAIQGVAGARIFERSPHAFREVVATRVLIPDAPVKVGIMDAAVAEFRAKGLDLVQEEILVDAGCMLARGSKGEVLWSVFWDADHTWSGGTWSLRHHADPFDAAGEQEVLLAIVRRAYGLSPIVAPVPLSSY